jgi:hypothetical protein
MTTDTFRKHGRGLTAPPEDAAAIAPSDGAGLSHVTRAIYVGGGGDLRLRLLGGGLVTLAAVPAGSLLPLRAVQVYATGTSATALVALW